MIDHLFWFNFCHKTEVRVSISDPELASLQVVRITDKLAATEVVEVPNVSPTVIAMVRHIERVTRGVRG